MILNADESLKLESSTQSGFMQETDNETYSIVRADGTRAGSVKVTDHTAVKGFKRTISVHQIDVNGKTVVNTSFNPS